MRLGEGRNESQQESMMTRREDIKGRKGTNVRKGRKRKIRKERKDRKERKGWTKRM